nr:unnamed protein product [Callosobruchus analis]
MIILVLLNVLCCYRRQHQSTTTWHGGGSPAREVGGQQTPPVKPSPDRLKGTTQDLFELLEKAQRSRIDDQRCMLPAYFNNQTLNSDLPNDLDIVNSDIICAALDFVLPIVLDLCACTDCVQWRMETNVACTPRNRRALIALEVLFSRIFRRLAFYICRCGYGGIGGINWSRLNWADVNGGGSGGRGGKDTLLLAVIMSIITEAAKATLQLVCGGDDKDLYGRDIDTSAQNIRRTLHLMPIGARNYCDNACNLCNHPHLWF